MIIDGGLILYIGLLVLWAWRWLIWWKHRRTHWVYINYLFVLYMLLGALLVYALILFFTAALKADGKVARQTLPGWLPPVMFGAPAACVVSFLLSGFQTMQHVHEISQDRAILKHDRAVQIIALPAVYGVMSMSALARMHQLIASPSYVHEAIHNSTETSSYLTAKEEAYLNKSETCAWVGDLYEAWALYQFAKLTLELIRASIVRRRRSSDPGQVEGAVALLTAYTAVESLAWLGVILFLVVCVLQAGWSLWILTFGQAATQGDMFQSSVARFGAAGMVASAGAIYNVHVVESTFHEYLEGYRPLLKFVTVKIIVSFAFFQRGIFKVLQGIDSSLPALGQRISAKVPLLGDILHFSEVEFQLFYTSLILYECVLIGLLHFCGWSASESWYLEDDEEDDGGAVDEEQKPLLADRPALGTV